MATIEERGPYQFRVKIRRQKPDGELVKETKTCTSRSEAEAWARIIEGKITGNEYVDTKLARGTTVSQACLWFLDRIAPLDEQSGKRMHRSDHAKNQASKLQYWIASDFANYAISALKPWDLLEWRDDLLDEAECSAQTITHRLNTLSQVYKEWSLAHQVSLDNPVTAKVRPSLDHGRSRRLDPNPDADGKSEEDRVLADCTASKSKWLRSAVIISIESCMRQAELAGLTWGRVRLSADHPHVDLPKTKNDRPRRIPLSARAVEAFKELFPTNGAPTAAHRVFPIETPRAFGHAWRAVIKEDQFPDLRWHDLRHEAISRLFELTDLRDNEIMAISGHLRPEMLTRYTHLRAHRLGSRLPSGALNPYALT